MRRWIILIGRCGTVLLAISLALLLVSLIPAAQTSGYSGDIGVFPKTFELLGMQLVLTPQQGLHLTITANGTLNIYLLEVNAWQTLTDWINNQRPQQNGNFYNITNLEAFLEANPNTIGWQTNVNNGKAEHEYVPTRITNASVVISNPSSEYARASYEGSVSGFVAPANKVRTLATWTIPVGLVLALPWLTSLLRTKTKHHES